MVYCGCCSNQLLLLHLLLVCRFRCCQFESILIESNGPTILSVILSSHSLTQVLRITVTAPCCSCAVVLIHLQVRHSCLAPAAVSISHWSCLTATLALNNAHEYRAVGTSMQTSQACLLVYGALGVWLQPCQLAAAETDVNSRFAEI